MGNDSAVSIQVGPDVIKPIVEAKIQAALVEALGGNSNIIENAVRAIMYAKVDSEGRFSTNNYSGDKSLIEWTCAKLVKQAGEEAIREYIATKKDVLVAEFKKQFAKKSKTIAEKMVDGILDSANARWGFNLTVDYKEKKDGQ